MRNVIIVLIVLAAALVIYFIAAGTDSIRLGGDAPPMKNGHYDTDASWTPPGSLSAFSSMAARFAPHADLGDPTLVVAPNAAVTRIAAASNKSMQMARVEISGTGGVGVYYDCTQADDTACPHVVCLCTPNTLLVPVHLGQCPENFIQHKVIAGVCGTDAKASETIVIYRDARAVTFFNLGVSAVTATVK
jgi:hypothetical protein